MGCGSSSIKEKENKRLPPPPIIKNENNESEEFITLMKENEKKEEVKIKINNKNKQNDLIEEKKVKNPTFLKDSILSDENKIIIPPPIKEYIVEGNDANENQKYIKRKYKGVTILENVKEYFHENLERDFIKNMVYNVLSGNIVKDKSKYIKGKNLTYDQVEGIIDILFKIVSENENVEKNEIDDERLNDVKVNIRFYDANEENIRKYIFKGKTPTEEEVENALNQFNSRGDQAKILAIEIVDE